MEYPNGAIKTFKELSEFAHTNTIYGASQHFNTIEPDDRVLSISLAKMHDHNIEQLNGYNDWFLFANREDAEAWANNS